MVGYENNWGTHTTSFKTRDWWILAQAVKAHKAVGAWKLEEYEHYLRGSTVPCHMRKYNTMSTRSKVPHGEGWKTLPFGKRCSICKDFLCEGMKNKSNCALYEE